MHIEDLRSFIQILTAGSVSAASRQWGIPKTSLSHRLRRLETEMRATLFLRRAGRLELTEAGAAFLPLAKDVIRSAERAEDVMGLHEGGQKARLRIGTTGDLSTRLVAPLSFGYMNRHPEMAIELIVLEHGGLFDPDIFLDMLVISGAVPDDKADKFTAHMLTSTVNRLYAAPRYVEQRGAPRFPEDLASHDLLEVTVGQRRQEWVITNDRRSFSIQPQSAVATNDPWITKLAAVHGLGIVCAPSQFVSDLTKVGALVPVLPDWHCAARALQVLVPQHRKSSAQIRSVTRYFHAHFMGFFQYPYRISDVEK